MSIRANSLRNLCVDGVYFTLVMSLVAFAATALAQDPQPRVQRVGDLAAERRLTDNHIDSRLNTDDNMPSGDPTESAEGKREAMILGMKLFERLQRRYSRDRRGRHVAGLGCWHPQG